MILSTVTVNYYIYGILYSVVLKQTTFISLNFVSLLLFKNKTLQIAKVCKYQQYASSSLQPFSTIIYFAELTNVFYIT